MLAKSGCPPSEDWHNLGATPLQGLAESGYPPTYIVLITALYVFYGLIGFLIINIWQNLGDQPPPHVSKDWQNMGAPPPMNGEIWAPLQKPPPHL